MRDSVPYIGRFGLDGAPESIFQGRIDEPTVYSRALSASEIQSIVSAGALGKDAITHGNLTGVVTLDGASNNTVGGMTPGERNVVSGNLGSGVVLSGLGTSGNVILGNYIGLNAAGDTAVPNFGEGVELNGDASGNTIGGSAPGAGNVISGNAFDGIGMFTGATGNFVLSNIIGADPTGTFAIANQGNGITLNGAPSNQIRGNLISGNGFEGVEIFGSGSTGNVVAGNRIGVNAAGSMRPAES